MIIFSTILTCKVCLKLLYVRYYSCEGEGSKEDYNNEYQSWGHGDSRAKQTEPPNGLPATWEDTDGVPSGMLLNAIIITTCPLEQRRSITCLKEAF